MQDAPSRKPSVAVAMPAYNEGDGIAEFVREIDRALVPHVSSLHVIVVDDASTDNTRGSLEAVRPHLGATLDVVVNPANRGHGPSVMLGYRLAVEKTPDYVLQVDGDGQFLGSDLRRMLVLLIDEAPAVCGVRRFRQDPWFRMVMTRLVRSYVRVSFGVAARDPNCPLRGYRAQLLRELLPELPANCLIPNLYLTVVASRKGFALVEVDVTHRVRRGAEIQGTSWGGSTTSPIPWRLVRFSLQALRESRTLRAQLLRASTAPPPRR